MAPYDSRRNEDRFQQMLDKLQSPDFRITLQRLAVLRILSAAQDVCFLEKLAYFDGEVIPERRITRKVRGLRNLYGDVRDHQLIENQGLFQIGKKSEVFVRFSTVTGEHGAADAAGDIVCQPLELMKLSFVKN